MFLLLFAILGLTSVMASDYERCKKFLEEDNHNISLYQKYFDSDSGLKEKYLHYKRGSTQMWEMSINSDDHKKVWLRFKAKSDELNDVKDVHKFYLFADEAVWNCSTKYV